MELRDISMRQVAVRLRNRGYVGSRPSCALRLEGPDDDDGRSRDLWLYVEKGKHTFPENCSMTTGWQGLTFNHHRPIPAGSLMLYACNYCRNSFGRPVSLDGWFCAAVYTPREQERQTMGDLLRMMGLSPEDEQFQALMKALGF